MGNYNHKIDSSFLIVIYYYFYYSCVFSFLFVIILLTDRKKNTTYHLLFSTNIKIISLVFLFLTQRSRFFFSPPSSFKNQNECEEKKEIRLMSSFSSMLGLLRSFLPSVVSVCDSVCVFSISFSYFFSL